GHTGLAGRVRIGDRSDRCRRERTTGMMWVARSNGMVKNILRALAFLSVTAAMHARAEVYELPPEGDDVIGAVSSIVARADDTLIDLARRHGLGYEDIVRANPGVDPWLPGEGTTIVLPTRFVLPPGPRKGVILNLAEYRMYYFPEPRAG